MSEEGAKELVNSADAIVNSIVEGKTKPKEYAGIIIEKGLNKRFSICLAKHLVNTDEKIVKSKLVSEWIIKWCEEQEGRE